MPKRELADTGSRKGVKKEICGINGTDLTKKTIKILRMFYSYNELELEKICQKVLLEIERFLRIWLLRSLTLEGKIVIVKIVSLSKVFIT